MLRFGPKVWLQIFWTRSQAFGPDLFWTRSQASLTETEESSWGPEIRNGSFSASVLTPVPVPVTISPQVILIILEFLPLLLHFWVQLRFRQLDQYLHHNSRSVPHPGSSIRRELRLFRLDVGPEHQKI